jgi:hypothetical protein
MPESPCAVCGDLCLHTDDDETPLCELCSEAVVWRRLAIDVASGRLDVSEEFIESLANPAPPDE